MFLIVNAKLFEQMADSDTLADGSLDDPRISALLLVSDNLYRRMLLLGRDLRVRGGGR